MHSKTNQRYQFGPFVLDPGKRLLKRLGEVVPLTPKAFDTLLVLVENSGNVVEKDELMNQLWPDTFVEESNLPFQVSTLRKALGESPNDHRYIVTIPGRGYRFLGEVRQAPSELEAEVVDDSSRLQKLAEKLDGDSLDRHTRGTDPEQAVHKPENFGDLIAPVSEDHVEFDPILNQEPKPISQRVPGAPPDLEKITDRWLQKDPTRRFQNMDDVKVALEELKEESGRLAGQPHTLRWTRRAWVWAAAALVLLAMAITGWLFRGPARKLPAAPEVVTLTSYVGFETSPSFSPDGNQVAFAWNGEKQDNYDIYVKLIGSPTPLRLTTDPADDVCPAFSPDGRSIGFLRVSKEQHATFIVIPAIGGPERIVAENLYYFGQWTNSFAWFPDGKWVVTGTSSAQSPGGLSLLSTDTGETRSLTSPPPKSGPDNVPAVSPDGRTIAFSRLTGYSAAEIYLLDLTEDLKPKGEPRRLTSLKGAVYGFAWTPNGREVIFSYLVFDSRGATLWKLPASGAAEPEQLPFNTGQALFPAISRSGNRLAYQRLMVVAKICRLSLSGPGVASGPATRFIASTRWDLAAQYSPDGKRIAFASDRSGTDGIWVSDADGSRPVELFSWRGEATGVPCWSADGQRVAFASGVGNREIYSIRASGGKPVRLTTDSAAYETSSWSRDGQWVYFSSDRTGRSELWKVSAAGGEAVQVSRNGGEVGFESADGKSIYYTKAEPSTGLWKMPLSGGEESLVLPAMAGLCFSPVTDGIYFIPVAGADGKSSLQFLSFATSKVQAVAPIPRPTFFGFSVSPDGRSVLFSQADEIGIDLMLVENFR